MAAFRVTPGIESDLASIVAIYNHYVLHTAVTFDTAPFDSASRKPWFDRFGQDPRHRLLVAVDDASTKGDRSILGYASSGPFHAKPAYGTSVETSIYVRAGCERQGIGSTLYTRLFDELRDSGAHRAYAGITQPKT